MIVNKKKGRTKTKFGIRKGGSQTPANKRPAKICFLFFLLEKKTTPEKGKRRKNFHKSKLIGRECEGERGRGERKTKLRPSVRDKHYHTFKHEYLSLCLFGFTRTHKARRR